LYRCASVRPARPCRTRRRDRERWRRAVADAAAGAAGVAAYGPFEAPADITTLKGIEACAATHR
jgi:hypothetical protein